MRNSTRILGALETELRKQVTFAFTVDRHHTRPGETDLRKGDRIRLGVYAFNQGDLTLTDLDGAITPGPAADFMFKRFQLAELKPLHKAQIATLEAEIIAKSPDGPALDQVAKLTVYANADLSKFRMRDIDRPLYFASAPSRHQARTKPGRRDTTRWTRRTPKGSIPLSAT